MSELNPYARFLDGRPLDAILAETGARLSSLLAAIGPEKAFVPPAPDKWSPAEIVCHLADSELVFAFRLRQTLAEDAPVIQPFDQEKWASAYSGLSAEQALQVFNAVREWNLRLIFSALPAAAGRQVTHPERGTMTFLTLVETMAGHDLNHLGQLQRLC
ncbi:MAG: DinB family protein [Terracidiphilus sp.]